MEYQEYIESIARNFINEMKQLELAKTKTVEAYNNLVFNLTFLKDFLDREGVENKFEFNGEFPFLYFDYHKCHHVVYINSNQQAVLRYTIFGYTQTYTKVYDNSDNLIRFLQEL